MQTVGIAAEYNPFHMGHLLHIRETKRIFADAAIVAVMSGNFVQRGDLAVFNKWARAKAAVLSGVDLVLELPVPYALSSAEHFARGSVALLEAAGVVDAMSFGSESGDLDALTRAASYIRSKAAGEGIRAAMKTGVSYGAACEMAARADGMSGTLFRGPNNILAIHYLAALRESGGGIRPVTIKRAEIMHDSVLQSGQYASARKLRELLRTGRSPWAYIPDAAAAVFRAEQRAGRGPVFLEDCEQAILALLRLREAEPPFPDDSEGVYNRLLRYAGTEGRLETVLHMAKTKRYHTARLRRALLSICIGIQAFDRPATPPYIRVLAAGPKGRTLLQTMRKCARLPVVTKPAKINTLDPAARRMFELERRGTDLFSLAYTRPEDRAGGSEWRGRPFIQ